MITVSSAWSALSKQSREKPVTLVRLYYGDETSYIPIATEDVTVEGVRYLGVLENNPRSQQAVDLFENTHTTSTFKLRIVNLEYEPGNRFSDLIETKGTSGDYGFYNRKVDAVLWLPGITTWANCFPLFTGYVRDIDGSDLEPMDWDCEDGSEIQYVEVPVDIFSDSDSYGDLGLPDEAVGKYKQSIYGDRRFGFASSTRSEFTAVQASQIMSPIVYLGRSGLNSNKYYFVANHIMNSVDALFGYDSSFGRFVKVPSFTIEQNTADGCIVSIQQDYHGDRLADNQATSDQLTEGNSVASWSAGNAILSSVTSSEGFAPHDGTYMMKMDPDTAADVYAYQTIATKSGRNYRVYAWLRSTDKDNTATIRVSDTGYTANDLGESGSVQEDATWELKFVDFQAKSETTYIVIRHEFVGGLSDYTYVDNVRVVDLDQSYYDYVFGDGTVDEEIAGWTNPTYSNDQSSSTAATMTSPSTPNTGVFRANFVKYDSGVSDDNIYEVRVLAFTDAVGAAPGTFTVNGTDVSGNTDDTTAFDCGTQADDITGAGAQVRVYLTSPTVGTTQYIYEIFKRVTYYPGSDLPIFASCRGMEYGTWINSRTGHYDNNNAGDVIENPLGMVESILRDQMGLTSTNIDLSSFNTVSAIFTTAKHVYYIDEKKSTRDIITDLLYQAGRPIMWMSPSRTWKVGYIANTYSSSNRVIDFDEVTGPKFSRTNIADLLTSVNVKYLKSLNSGNLQAESGRTTSSAAQTYYNISEDQSNLDIEAEAIRVATAATNLGSYVLKNRKLIHNIFEGTLDKQYLDLDIMDIIEFSNVPREVFGETITANVTRNSQTVYKYWMIYDVRRGADGITIKAMQLHNLS